MIIFKISSYSGLVSVVPLFYIVKIIRWTGKTSKTEAVMFPRDDIKILLFLGAAYICIAAIGGIICIFI